MAIWHLLAIGGIAALVGFSLGAGSMLYITIVRPMK
jgi:hypothetical protein